MNRQQRLEKCAYAIYRLRTKYRGQYARLTIPMDTNTDWQIAQRLEPDTPGSQRESEWSFADDKYMEEFFENHFVWSPSWD